MGFALWTEPELAWVAGTSEYRGMGVAVISRTDLFRPADFRRERRTPRSPAMEFAGYFASLGQVNAHLQRQRGVSRMRRRSAPGAHPAGWS
jgi:hypothetical protein